jgi:hypothetical protein
MNSQLFDMLEATGGMFIPLTRDRGKPHAMRLAGRSAQGEFPPWMIRDK